MKIKFVVFYWAPDATQPEFPSEIIGPFKDYSIADAYGSNLGEGSYSVETVVKP